VSSGRFTRSSRRSLRLSAPPAVVTAIVLAILAVGCASDARRASSVAPASAPPGHTTYHAEGYSFALPERMRDPERTPTRTGATVLFDDPVDYGGAGAGLVTVSVSRFDRGLEGFVVSNELALSLADGFRRVSQRDVGMPGAAQARLARSSFLARAEGGEEAEVEVASLYAISPRGLAVMLRTVEPRAHPGAIDERAVLGSGRFD